MSRMRCRGVLGRAGTMSTGRGGCCVYMRGACVALVCATAGPFSAILRSWHRRVGACYAGARGACCDTSMVWQVCMVSGARNRLR